MRVFDFWGDGDRGDVAAPVDKEVGRVGMVWLMSGDGLAFRSGRQGGGLCRICRLCRVKIICLCSSFEGWSRGRLTMCNNQPDSKISLRRQIPNTLHVASLLTNFPPEQVGLHLIRAIRSRFRILSDSFALASWLKKKANPFRVLRSRPGRRFPCGSTASS